MQLPRLYTKEAMDAAAGPAPGTTKTVAARPEMGLEAEALFLLLLLLRRYSSSSSSSHLWQIGHLYLWG